uniref:Uncharacterized protein n=1 Tax=Arundo donax TaxID=35708 RepID=A0A0A9A3R9_ARUDO
MTNVLSHTVKNDGIAVDHIRRLSYLSRVNITNERELYPYK